MENASKALIMAAEILIGILILSLAVFLFTSFATTSAEIYKQNQENRLNEFNSQFTSYEGKDEVTIYDVITVANLATENNKYYEFDKRLERADGKDNYISVIFTNTKSSLTSYNGKTIENLDNNKYDDIIKQDLKNMVYSQEKDKSELTQYKVTVKISKTTDRVYWVQFDAKT